ncbi:formate dehydrogenase accessory protein FdhE [Desulfosoma caldarium]|uniref:Formate dehydrogenase formation protein n=1 Tax=Desulfosoma caldarium TaxID=610254 RepID=A0A3N1VL47_9BACT|nr:formate dehydrogenase accessory protein FdhE [Desulfosoma caldarium]ROR03515.1 formate dehydrogenase formation protein [Desulfosoma caldarium]
MLSDAETIMRKAVALARSSKPAYHELYDFLERVFAAQIQVKPRCRLSLNPMDGEAIKARWTAGLPLMRRWDFPVDLKAAHEVLEAVTRAVPEHNRELSGACSAIFKALAQNPSAKDAIWESFLHHDWNPWEEWLDTAGVDLPSLLYVARSCLRPSIERTAEERLQRACPDDHWKAGFCPVCGSLPSLISLEGEGQRRAHCSWCGTPWRLARFQCPVCDNRRHASLGYLYAEQEPGYRIDYCMECRHYFKTIDARERLWPLWIPLEEWTTLHLDLVAQREGWKTPPSPAPAVYETDGFAVPS